MKILIIPNNTTNNCFGVRNKLPADFLEKRGHEIRIKNEMNSYYSQELKKYVIDPEDIDWCDTVVFNRHYDFDHKTLKNLINYAKANGKKVIYETDDLLEALNSSNPMYQGIQNNIPQVRMMSANADLCTTTGESLKSELLKYNPNVEILPNCVDPKLWKLRKGGNEKVKVGYAGGSSHNEDILLILDVVRDLQKDIDFEFVIFGLSPINWDNFIEKTIKRHEEQTKGRENLKPNDWYLSTVALAEKLKSINWEHKPFVPHAEYNGTLSKLNFDIGLCPLVDNRFNRSKSAIKFYEYAMVGTACLASKVTPYKEEVGYLAKNKHNHWYSKLKNLILDKELREKITKEQREWVLKNIDIKNNIHLWEKAYNY